MSGAPGAGKTTLARPLARALGFALISKDDIKEPMFDALGAEPGNLEISRKIGGASWEVLWSLARQCPHVVLEANFHPDNDYERERIAGLEGEIVEVFCRCPPEEAARRHNARAKTDARHRAHAAFPVLAASDLAPYDRPISVSRVFEVDTMRPVDIAALSAAIGKSWTIR